MIASTFWKLSLALALSALPIAGSGEQESAMSAPAFTTNQESTVQATAAETTTSTNTPTPEAAAQQLENAPGQVVSTAAASPQDVSLTVPAANVVKLAQAGLADSVMLAFVTNSPNTFNLNSDAIIYLNDIGVPATVINAMIEHDQTLKENYANSLVPAASPVYSYQQSPAADSSASYSTPYAASESAEAQPPPVSISYGEATQPANVSYTYFYNSLAPYGNWIDISGYGLCWQPTVALVNPDWQPYCNNGNWIYSDNGWYWASDYSWGWGPFHYGRWFRNQRFGWCWAPGTVWAPAWVSWRYTPYYCGWAPLPPTACFTPGLGFTYFGRPVGFSFGFGLGANCFTFVAYHDFCNHHLSRYRLPRHRVGTFFHQSRTIPGVRWHNRTMFNDGIPVRRIAMATHRQIHRAQLRNAANPATARNERARWATGSTLAVYRPNLPLPTHRVAYVGQGVRPAWGHAAVPRLGKAPGLNRGRVGQDFVGSRGWQGQRRLGTVPIFQGRPVVARRNNAPATAFSGGNNTATYRTHRQTAPAGSVIKTRPRYEGRPRVFNRPPTVPVPPVQPTPPVRNNARREFFNRNWQRQYREARPFFPRSQTQFPQRALPTQWRPVAPARSQPRIVAPAGPHWYTPVPHRPVPALRAEPARPRFEARPMPRVHASPAARLNFRPARQGNGNSHGHR